MLAPAYLISVALHLSTVHASPAQQTFISNNKPYDVQAHRGGRGNTVENTLPSFAWGLIDGATTLELDNGITLDGEVVVWHDNQIMAEKCVDTHPVFPDDPTYPYVGKFIANLTLAQIKTLDCGSKRQSDFRTSSLPSGSTGDNLPQAQQLLYPGARIQTLQEVFDFVECADPSHQILWNIESKINPEHPDRTARVEDFVQKQHAIFSASPYYGSITYQSFDWRTLVAMKELDPLIPISALIDEETAFMPDNNTSPWLGGLHLDGFPGPSPGQKIAQAARAIHADIFSPCGTCFIPSSATFGDDLDFTTQAMVWEAHALGMSVKPWTLNSLDNVDKLVQFGVDGIITDYPSIVRRWTKQQGFAVAPKYPKQRVFSCLETHLH